MADIRLRYLENLRSDVTAISKIADHNMTKDILGRYRERARVRLTQIPSVSSYNLDHMGKKIKALRFVLEQVAGLNDAALNENVFKPIRQHANSALLTASGV
jgi:hypothetical protein